MCLHAQFEMKTLKVPAHRISIARVLRAYRQAMRQYKSRPDEHEDLFSLLSTAIIDDYDRANKTSRDYPRKKQEQAAGPPKITTANNDQKQHARQIKDQMEKGLTA